MTKQIELVFYTHDGRSADELGDLIGELCEEYKIMLADDLEESGVNVTAMLFQIIEPQAPKVRASAPPKRARSEWEDALEDLEDLIAACENLPERAEDFAHDVINNAQDMASWIESREHVTDAQLRAIENWQEGVARWER